MIIVRNVAASLAFRSPALRALAAKRSVMAALVYFSIGFLIFVLIRNSVYSGLREYADLEQPGILGSLLRLNLFQIVLFLSLVYLPSIICLSNAIAGDGLGLSVSREEYQTQISALFPLWGTLFFLAAPLQLVVPEFLVLGIFGISIGLLVLILLLVVYTVWAIRELNYISTIAALGVFSLSWCTLPVFYILSMFFFALPFFILLPVAFLGFQRFRSYVSGREEERAFQRHLHVLSTNPQDGDAQYQLGLIHLRRGNLAGARTYFENARKIDPEDPDYHYYLGRVFEAAEDWGEALEQYEETYRLNPDYGQGDIFREVGKGYLQTDKVEKALEFLRFFLDIRSSDPEGRYWLALSMQKLGRTDEMRVQLHTIMEQARSQPRFFRREKREWVHRSRVLLREQ